MAGGEQCRRGICRKKEGHNSKHVFLMQKDKWFSATQLKWHMKQKFLVGWLDFFCCLLFF